MTLTPAGIGMLPPSYAIIKGQPSAGAVPDGYVIVEEKLIDGPPLEAVKDKVPVLPDWVKEPVSVEGFGGRNPAS